MRPWGASVSHNFIAQQCVAPEVACPDIQTDQIVVYAMMPSRSPVSASLAHSMPATPMVFARRSRPPPSHSTSTAVSAGSAVKAAALVDLPAVHEPRADHEPLVSAAPEAMLDCRLSYVPTREQEPPKDSSRM